METISNDNAWNNTTLQNSVPRHKKAYYAFYAFAVISVIVLSLVL